MLLSIIENISSFIYKITTNGLTSDMIFYLGVGFIVFMVLFFMIKSRYAYEGRLERSLESINRWLYTHQQIDESNLVEFNKLIKKSPRLLRYHWQQYMLYREHEPSHYMSVYNCIEKPLHTSSFNSNIKNFIGICCATMLFTFVLSLLSYGSVTFTVETFANSLITPVIILLVAVLFLILLRAMQNFNLSSLYQNFHLFNRYVDKASTSIPKYVDFEILFTRKEIRGGIPVLNEYLEKRARQEAEELERARQNAVEHEAYAFERAGIDGSLILDRAMKESEIYLNSRQRLLTQIQQYDSEIESLKRNYENTSKDYQRKLQASKENIERLRQQQEESTNRIEVNYIRKQQQDEIKKQEQLEKDQDDATLRYDQETSTLKEQIDKCRAELEEKKEYATTAMLSEYDTFSTKLFKAILKDVEDKHKQEVDELAEQKVEALKELEKAREINDIKDSVINDLREIIHQKENSFSEEGEEQNVEDISIVPTEKAEDEAEGVEVQKPAEDGYYDDKGYYWYKDGTYYDDKGLYHSNDGKVYDQEGNLVEGLAEEVPAEEPAEEVSAEVPAEELPEAEQSEEKPAEEMAEQPAEEEKAEEGEQQPELAEEMAEEKPAEELPQEEQPVEEVHVEEVPTEEPVEELPAEQAQEEHPAEENVEEVPQEKPAEQKKGRGRPKKAKEEPAGQKKGRGRPKKEKTEEEPAGQKKGRGRPKKEKSEEAVPAGEKRGRGRPKKEKTEEENKPKRGRGRPKKDELEDLSNQILEESTRLRDQQSELNKQLDETLQQIREHQEKMAEAANQKPEEENPNGNSSNE